MPLKVKPAFVQGGQTVIVPDENASLADLYDALRVDAALDLGGTAAGGARSAAGAPVEVPLNQTFWLGPGLTLDSPGTLRFITAIT